MADPVGVISAVNTVIDTAKKLREIADKIQDAETQNLIADLNLELADLKIQIADLQNENLQLQEKLREANRAEDLRGKLEERDGVYYLKEPVPGRDEGPYCPACFENKGKLMPLSSLPASLREVASYSCPNCDATI